LLPQLRTMTRALVHSSVRGRLLRLAILLVLVIAATAYGQIRLNRWNRPFYDALSHRELSQFLWQLAVFAMIAGSLLALNVAQQWLSQMLTLRLREGLVQDLVGHWLAPRRAFQLSHAGPMGVNPDQRMHEDARHLTELSATLGIGLLQASMLLAAFVDVLWTISSDFALRVGQLRIAIPGYMVWAAVVYAGSASLISWRVGRDLIPRNAQRYAREAQLRYSLVRVNEHIDAIALADGEAQEAQRIDADLRGVLRAMRRLVSGLTNLTWVTAGYGWFTLVAPIIAATPLYFSGTLSFGGLMMAAGAFGQVQSSLRWFVDNFSTIADWRATLLRVAAFRLELSNTEAMHPRQDRIDFVAGDPGTLRFERLQIASPGGCVMLDDPDVRIAAGERVQIIGAPGVGKTLLFRTLAGLWVWGTGRIVRPEGQSMLFLPRRAYLPPGTLREVLAYPKNPTDFAADAFGHVLARCGLAALQPQLDLAQNWALRLNEDAQAQLSIARAALHAPDWLILDDVFAALDATELERVLAVLGSDLSRTAVLHIGGAPVSPTVFPRTLKLVNDPATHRLERRVASAA
jgi:putative ATP-binding cassette transporter